MGNIDGVSGRAIDNVEGAGSVDSTASLQKLRDGLSQPKLDKMVSLNLQHIFGSVFHSIRETHATAARSRLAPLADMLNPSAPLKFLSNPKGSQLQSLIRLLSDVIKTSQGMNPPLPDTEKAKLDKVLNALAHPKIMNLPGLKEKLDKSSSLSEKVGLLEENIHAMDSAGSKYGYPIPLEDAKALTNFVSEFRSFISKQPKEAPLGALVTDLLKTLRGEGDVQLSAAIIAGHGLDAVQKKVNGLNEALADMRKAVGSGTDFKFNAANKGIRDKVEKAIADLEKELDEKSKSDEWGEGVISPKDSNSAIWKELDSAKKVLTTISADEWTKGGSKPTSDILPDLKVSMGGAMNMNSQVSSLATGTANKIKMIQTEHTTLISFINTALQKLTAMYTAIIQGASS